MVEEKLLMGASSESTRASGLWSRSWHRAILSAAGIIGGSYYSNAISSFTSNKLQTICQYFDVDV